MASDLRTKAGRVRLPINGKEESVVTGGLFAVAASGAVFGGVVGALPVQSLFQARSGPVDPDFCGSDRDTENPPRFGDRSTFQIEQHDGRPMVRRKDVDHLAHDWERRCAPRVRRGLTPVP